MVNRIIERVMTTCVTFIVKDAAVFQGEYVGFTVLQLIEVVADFQTLQVPCGDQCQWHGEGNQTKLDLLSVYSS